MERAVVTSSVGCEGLEVQNGCHLVVADDPGLFAAATLELLRSAETRARLGGSGRRLVEDEYDWSILGQRFRAELENVSKGHDTCDGEQARRSTAIEGV